MGRKEFPIPHDENVRGFTETFLEPLYDYIDENLDDTGATLAILERYKRRTEWFHRDRLYRLWESDTRRGERHIAMDLYEYLFSEGVDFFIEPSSASGEADMVSSQEGETPLIADAKIFVPERSKGVSYIAAGFNQLYNYTLDFNQTVGFLVIFKASESDLRFALPDSGITGIPNIVHNNKCIFFVLVDLFPHSQPASKRGKLKVYEITLDDLLDSTRGVAPDAV